MTIAAIDFDRLYRDHLAAASREQKSARDWDTHAAKMSRKLANSTYADQFIARMNLTGSRTLLDVGCGPGTICLPLAAGLERVTGLDFSQGMLDALAHDAAARNLNNVQALHLSWEDDWSAVPESDIVVASRSTNVQDIARALAKLHAKARQRVYLTHLVGGRFIDPTVFEAIGRKTAPLPDYIYILNILHTMGIHPCLDYVEQESRLAGTANFDEFCARVSWALGELSHDERERLRAWYQSNPGGGGATAPMRWAFISWEKTPA